MWTDTKGYTPSKQELKRRKKLEELDTFAAGMLQRHADAVRDLVDARLRLSKLAAALDEQHALDTVAVAEIAGLDRTIRDSLWGQR